MSRNKFSSSLDSTSKQHRKKREKNVDIYSILKYRRTLNVEFLCRIESTKMCPLRYMLNRQKQPFTGVYRIAVLEIFQKFA